MSAAEKCKQVPPRCWKAGLTLELSSKGESTVLNKCSHFGPLRVQRPFYPSDRKECHLYLLHPPGGLVSGDELVMDVTVGESGHGLFTTPSAGKFYKGDHSLLPQVQRVDFYVKEDAVGEWLPQETIFFDGARGQLDTRVSLDKGANAVVWDIICLGRPACNEGFTKGFVQQRLSVYRKNRPVYLENNRFVAGEPALQSCWGLHGQPVTGAMVATLPVNNQKSDATENDWVAEFDHSDALFSVTQVDDLLIARYIGPSAVQCRELFVKLWSQLRPKHIGKNAEIPRIWNT
ncbi:urease accessory protein UreD [Porticoccus sp. W117]|uniref:urease accessory protein UreD n=1 Tax=Porticoccus sp. W117 TaxID=3054777 RepID=UPI002598BE10|nr:urease accessory protein UreD [Porticoccus sp. W117]MDM3872336.1 urease accessory protein UreD [Porticoccus sp. W117]